MADVYPGWYAGYYEISYFHTNYFNVYANQQNVQAFTGINLYGNPLVNSSNYEHIFLTYDIYSNDPTSEPLVNSLFNTATFQTLINLGESTPNIVGADSSLVYGIDFYLNDEWYALTATLGLDFP